MSSDPDCNNALLTSWKENYVGSLEIHLLLNNIIPSILIQIFWGKKIDFWHQIRSFEFSKFYSAFHCNSFKFLFLSIDSFGMLSYSSLLFFTGMMVHTNLVKRIFFQFLLLKNFLILILLETMGKENWILNIQFKPK